VQLKLFLAVLDQAVSANSAIVTATTALNVPCQGTALEFGCFLFTQALPCRIIIGAGRKLLGLGGLTMWCGQPVALYGVHFY
jgi:hypothetical protein